MSERRLRAILDCWDRDGCFVEGLSKLKLTDDLAREVARMLEAQREVDAKIADRVAEEHKATAAAWRAAKLADWEDQAPDYERRRAVAEEIAAAIRSQR